MNSNPIVLNFHESLLRRSDVELLKGPYWLNDSIISFYFEYLERYVFKRHPVFLFISPEVTQCIKVTPDNEIGVFLDPLQAHKKKFIFFALNDNEQTEHSGGSHWSLLVFSQLERTVFHYDSSKGSNQDQAMDLGNKILRYFGMPSYSNFIEAPCLQQRNGYDCGIHVLCNVEHLAEHACKYNKIDGVSLLQTAYEFIAATRSRLLELVFALKDK